MTGLSVAILIQGRGCMGCFESRERPLLEVGPVSQGALPVEVLTHPLPTTVDCEEVLSLVLANQGVAHLRSRPLTYAAFREASWRWSRIREGNWATLVYKVLLDSLHSLARVADRRSRASLRNGLPREHAGRGLSRINRTHQDWKRGADQAWQHYTRIRRDFLRGGFELSRYPLSTTLRLITRRLFQG